ncbi:MAG TPA: thiamine pyrophosphate-dependent dehydrogenase E1 component subunit alpha [Gammaproteobacteria bacterium]|nr:thiamine pyrophosphate-dependent dehydrogenase E1 component subunit alpha [Gammaproteobacteria bacterium]
MDMAGLYRKILTIRCFEEKVDWLFSRGLLGGTTHLCIGQEAVAVGVAEALGPDDYVVSTHRGHGHLISRGADLARIFAELLGLREGYCRGNGGTQHLCAPELGFLGTNGITGGGIPIAAGAGLSIKLSGEDRLSVCFFGDGASNQGVFYETLNMAAVWSLPVLFVCENNLYGMSTPFADVSPYADVARKADAFGVKSSVVDGMDVIKVAERARGAAGYVRSGGGPVLLEAKTYRYCGHSKSDPRSYRTAGEEAAWKAKDPVVTMELALLELMGRKEIDALSEEVTATVDAAYDAALAGTEPTAADSMEGVYAERKDLIS